jgi:hypothetical protein
MPNHPPIPPSSPVFVQLCRDYHSYTKGAWLFSISPTHADPKWWSHDEDFPWMLDLLKPASSQRLLVACVARCAWLDKAAIYPVKSPESLLALMTAELWRKWGEMGETDELRQHG